MGGLGAGAHFFPSDERIEREESLLRGRWSNSCKEMMNGMPRLLLPDNAPQPHPLQKPTPRMEARIAFVLQHMNRTGWLILSMNLKILAPR